MYQESVITSWDSQSALPMRCVQTITKYILFFVYSVPQHNLPIKLCVDTFACWYVYLQLRPRSFRSNKQQAIHGEIPLGSLTLGYQTFSRNSGKENLHDLINSQRPGDCNVKHYDQFALMKFHHDPEYVKCKLHSIVYKRAPRHHRPVTMRYEEFFN